MIRQTSNPFIASAVALQATKAKVRKEAPERLTLGLRTKTSANPEDLEGLHWELLRHVVVPRGPSYANCLSYYFEMDSGTGTPIFLMGVLKLTGEPYQVLLDGAFCTSKSSHLFSYCHAFPSHNTSAPLPSTSSPTIVCRRIAARPL